MTTLISETMQSVLGLLVGDFFKYSTAVVLVFGVLGLVFRLTGKAK